MLVLSRKPGEDLVIFDANTHTTIQIKVLQHKGNQVRIGVDAPSSLIVDRREIFDKRMENELSAYSNVVNL